MSHSRLILNNKVLSIAEKTTFHSSPFIIIKVDCQGQKNQYLFKLK